MLLLKLTIVENHIWVVQMHHYIDFGDIKGRILRRPSGLSCLYLL